MIKTLVIYNATAQRLSFVELLTKRYRGNLSYHHAQQMLAVDNDDLWIFRKLCKAELANVAADSVLLMPGMPALTGPDLDLLRQTMKMSDGPCLVTRLEGFDV